MLNGKYVNIEMIIAGAYRDLGLSDQINFEDSVEWVGEAMELLAVPHQYIDKTAYIPIKEYRGPIPCDLLYFVSVNGSTDFNEDCPSDVEFYPMRYASDTFHHRYCDNLKCNKEGVTYKVNDNFIFPDFEEGTVAVSYKAMATDERGFPLIPDNVKYRRAATDYLKWKLGFIELKKGKMVSQVYQILEQEKLHSMGAAQNEGNMPTLDQMESIKNDWLRLIPKINAHSNNFSETSSPERRLIHNGRGNNLRKEYSSIGGTYYYTS